jgi:hypothetical protein
VPPLLPWLRWWADLLDSRFRIPGTTIRFGLDPILSLVPGLGDLASPIFAIVLIVEGVRLHVPKVVMARMALNALIDAAIGAIPVAGNVGDIFWRANNANLSLLERHAHPGKPPTPGDYLFVGAVAVSFGLIVAIPVLLGMWLAWELWKLVS